MKPEDLKQLIADLEKEIDGLKKCKIYLENNKLNEAEISNFTKLLGLGINPICRIDSVEKAKKLKIKAFTKVLILFKSILENPKQKIYFDFPIELVTFEMKEKYLFGLMQSLSLCHNLTLSLEYIASDFIDCFSQKSRLKLIENCLEKSGWIQNLFTSIAHGVGLNALFFKKNILEVLPRATFISLINMLPFYSNLNTVCFEGLNISDEQLFQHFLEMISKCAHLKNLQIINCALNKLNDNLFIGFCNIIKSLKNLEKIDLSSTQLVLLNAKKLNILRDALSNCKKLVKLTLSNEDFMLKEGNTLNNHSYNVSFQILVNIFPSISSLTHLHITCISSDMSFRDNIYVLQNALSETKSLRYFTMDVESYYNFAVEFTKALTDNELVLFNFGKQYFQPNQEGLEELSSLLINFKALTAIDMSGCYDHLHNIELKDSDDINEGRNTMYNFGKNLSQCKTLKYLNLSGFFFETLRIDYFIFFLRGLISSSSLEFIQIGDNWSLEKKDLTQKVMEIIYQRKTKNSAFPGNEKHELDKPDELSTELLDKLNEFIKNAASEESSDTQNKSHTEFLLKFIKIPELEPKKVGPDSLLFMCKQYAIKASEKNAFKDLPEELRIPLTIEKVFSKLKQCCVSIMTIDEFEQHKVTEARETNDISCLQYFAKGLLNLKNVPEKASENSIKKENMPDENISNNNQAIEKIIGKKRKLQDI